jgi:pyrroline-5-carboxylate reductase
MGISILGGILSSLQQPTSLKESKELPGRLPTEFIACVRGKASVKTIQEAIPQTDLYKIWTNDNVLACTSADIVLLACKPYMVGGILGAEGMKEALENKTLVSICAGISALDLEEALYGDVFDEDPVTSGRCRMIRAMPNTASSVRESMTVIASYNPPVPDDIQRVVDWIFTRVGQVTHLPENLMDAACALCGSGPAFFLTVLEAAADGGLAMGIPRAESIKMAAQTMKGAACMVLNGEHPSILKDRVTTPGGCTIGGLMVLEEGGVRGTVARAVREATVVASLLGKGVKNVNGTRH